MQKKFLYVSILVLLAFVVIPQMASAIWCDSCKDPGETPCAPYYHCGDNGICYEYCSVPGDVPCLTSSGQSCPVSTCNNVGGHCSDSTKPYCVKWLCPNGGGADGQCTAADLGAYYECSPDNNCNFGTYECGQIDYYTKGSCSNIDWDSLSSWKTKWTSCSPPGRCGDGSVNQVTEECDAGSQNGVACTPAYGGSCTYCSSNCQIITVDGGFCGNNIKDGTEQCEPPLWQDNTYCSQEPYGGCSDHFTNRRDQWGYCNSHCQCLPDSWSTECIIGSCGADCRNSDDCLGGYCSETYSDSCSNTKLIDYNNDGIKNSKVVTDSCDNSCSGCLCSECLPDCSAEMPAAQCVMGQCGASCAANSDCDDNNQYTRDTCNLQSCSCEHTAIPYCGNNILNNGEECEPPSSSNNNNCPQSTSECSGAKYAIRDAYGNCDATCGCVEDSLNYQCVKGRCGATCAENSDCNDNDEHTLDTCSPRTCSCKHTDTPYCGDGTVNNGEHCDDGNSNNNDACKNDCTNNYCGDGYINSGVEECESDADCDEGSCSDCECVYEPSTCWCGDGICNCGETEETCPEDCGCEEDECPWGPPITPVRICFGDYEVVQDTYVAPYNDGHHQDDRYIRVEKWGTSDIRKGLIQFNLSSLNPECTDV
ncbi:MAG: hypothetical protein ABIG95_04905, partial [Candidatus Woesearchaeota archaeon]